MPHPLQPSAEPPLPPTRRVPGTRSGDVSASASASAALMPVLVEGASGRTGSTLIMALLGTSERVVFERVAPFEHEHLAFAARVAALYKRPAETRRPPRTPGERLDRMLARRRGRPVDAGTPPGPGRAPAPRRRMPGDLLERLDDGFPYWKRHLAAHWVVLSAALCEASELPRAPTASAPDAGGRSGSGSDGRVTSRPEARRLYYAEKAPRWLAAELEGVIPVRRIHRLRDPRDVWLSIEAFDARRGRYGFGRRPRERRGVWLERFLAQWREALQALLDPALAADPRATVVRYERLVTDLEGEAARLGAWLGVTLDAGRALDATRAMRPGHATSTEPARSIGRWRGELEPALAVRFREALGPLLEAHGYEPG